MKKTLFVFDLDDCLFKTSAKIIIRNKKNKIVKKITPKEYNSHILKSDYSFDYKEFVSSKKFFYESVPIDNVLQIVRNLYKIKNYKTIILTARSDLNDKKLFLDTFRKNDIKIDEIYVERAGNHQIFGELPDTTKSRIISDYIDNHHFEKVIFFDDSEKNLYSFLKLKEHYPNVILKAYKVDEGLISHFRK